jgi:DNA-binding transcriptional regulator YdaS (Cro superfamily)
MNISDLIRSHFGNSKAALSVAAGVTRQAVTQWGDSDVLKAEYVIPVCESLGWKVHPHTLRPDIYPNRGDGLPAKAKKVA